MFHRRSVLKMLPGLMASGLVGCRPPRASSDERKRVVTTFTIIQDMAQAVAGEAALVESVTKPGAEIHDYEPTPKDIVKAQKADLVLWNGLGLERWFQRFFSRVSEVASAVVSEGVAPMGIAEGPYTGKANPHAWMSPQNALIYVENIRKGLANVDPANEATYSANAAAYSAKIRTIGEAMLRRLSEIPVDQRWLVSSEGAFSYLARDNQMRELYLWPVNADQEGTPQQIKKVIDTVRKFKIPVIFSESTISDKAIKQVAAETGVRYGGVLYVDSLTEADGPVPTYLRMLEVNAETITKGFLKS